MTIEGEIRAVCSAMKSEGVPINLGAVSVQPGNNDYQKTCEDIMNQVYLLWWKERRVAPSLWSPDFIRKVSGYGREHGIHLEFVSPLHETALGRFSASLAGSTIKIGMYALFDKTISQTLMLSVLDHEYGHYRDRKMVFQRYPGLKSLLVDTNNVPRKELGETINAHFELMRKFLSGEDKKRFSVLSKEFIGRYQFNSAPAIRLAKLYLVVAELFRSGEEAYDPAKKEYLMQASEYFTTESKADNGDQFVNPHTVTGAASPVSRFVRLPDHSSTTSRPRHSGVGVKSDKMEFNEETHHLMVMTVVAILQEAGYWKEIETRKDFNHSKAADFVPTHLEFFRLCIRGARKYFLSRTHLINMTKAKFWIFGRKAGIR